MTAPGNYLLLLVLTLSILLSSAYAVGRIHQWNKHGLERDEAYRLGYEKASLSIITMMSRRSHAVAGQDATVTPLAGRARVRPGRPYARVRGLPVENLPPSSPARREECERTGT